MCPGSKERKSDEKRNSGMTKRSCSQGSRIIQRVKPVRKKSSDIAAVERLSVLINSSKLNVSWPSDLLMGGQMNGLIRPLLTMLLVVGAVGRSAQKAEDDRRTDAYAVYSIIMNDPTTSHGPYKGEVFLIGEMTQPGTPAEPCVRVPPQYEQAYRELLNEYYQRRDKPVKLERAFNISKSYQLLDADEVKEFVAIHSLRRTPYPNPNELFQKTSDLFTFSDVYFNQSRTLALTAVSTFCGSLCASVKWKIFQKTSEDRWEERPWVFCTTVADDLARRALLID